MQFQNGENFYTSKNLEKKNNLIKFCEMIFVEFHLVENLTLNKVNEKFPVLVNFILLCGNLIRIFLKSNFPKIAYIRVVWKNDKTYANFLIRFSGTISLCIVILWLHG